jgi:hypothetical protein
MKVSELQGPALDWAVARCEGYTYEIDRDECWLNHRGRPNTNLSDYYPSKNWELGGPIIEREKIEWRWMDGRKSYGAEKPNQYLTFLMDGPSILIAAMRCYVASKLGYMIEIPEELR